MLLNTPSFKTRLAPTPSGYLHLGNILSFVVTLALAEKMKAKVLLRIDDMDRERADQQFIANIFETLHFLDIPWDEGPRDAAQFEAHFAQCHRMHLYDAALQHLITGGHVFACTCSRKDILKENPEGSYPGTCIHKGLPLNTPNSALRLYTPDKTALKINTLSGVQYVEEIPASLRHFVIRKRDGFPAYQLASVVDDLYFGVNLVVRGADLWQSTLAQLYLASLLGANNFASATFFHHLLVLDENGKKMSKSAGATSVYHLKKEGKSKTEIFTAIGKMLGITEPLDDWQSLAAAMAGVPALHNFLG